MKRPGKRCVCPQARHAPHEVSSRKRGWGERPLDGARRMPVPSLKAATGVRFARVTVWRRRRGSGIRRSRDASPDTLAPRDWKVTVVGVDEPS